MKQSRDHKYVRGRIEILDEILRGARKYTFLDLMEKLNGSLELAGYPEISRKTLFNDLKFLKEEKGAPINKPTHNDPYYYYTEKFSIKNIQLDEEEIEFLIDFFESSGDKENVKLAFEMGTSMFPFSSAILLRKAEWLTEQTKFGQALKALDDADLIDPHNIESLFLRVDILSDTNKHEEAIFILDRDMINIRSSLRWTI